MLLDSQDQFLRNKMEYFCSKSIFELPIHEECLLLEHGVLRDERCDGVVVLGLLLLESCLVVYCHHGTVAVSAVVHLVHLVERPDVALQSFRQMFRDLNHGLLLVLSRSPEII